MPFPVPVAPAMPKPRAFLLLLFIVLLPGVSPDCQTGTAAACMNATFVPGHNLLGEGIDVTTLGRTGAYLVDTSQWRGPNGTCTLCRNPVQGGQWQRLPLAVVDWRAQVACRWRLSSSVQKSAMGMMESSSAVILNNWKVGLTVSVLPVGVWLGLAGSHSKLAQFVMQKARQDKYSFISHEVSCQYYRFRVSRTPPLAQDFIQTVKNLPSTYNKTSQPEYHHLIQTYGTHYVSQVYLGGRARDVTAVRVCQAALEELSVEEIEACLSVEASLNLKLISLGAGFSKCKKQRTAMSSQQSFHEQYRERLVEVEGGQNTADLLFSSTSPGAFSEWVKTVKSLPGLLTYSLRPIHTLVQQDSAKREALRQAVSEYILKRALRRKCTQSCPQGARPSALDPCSCTSSSGDGFINPFGCSRLRGLGKLLLTVERAHGLRGDVFSKTDAYVKVFFVGREIRTWIIGNNDNPVWNNVMDFGSVHVTAGSYVKVEVWDKDRWRDDHLGSCNIRLTAGGPHHTECYLKHGRIQLHYSLRCGPHLGGPSCSEYVSQPQPQHTIAMGKYPL